jgi:hypothetical protein
MSVNYYIAIWGSIIMSRLAISELFSIAWIGLGIIFAFLFLITRK